jgi:hypothetical protein
MELIEGPTLADRIAPDGKPVPIPLDEALGIARQIGKASEAAHEKNIVQTECGQLMVAEVIEKGGTLEIDKIQQLFDGLSRTARI